MAAINSYATLAEFKEWSMPNAGVDADDDTLIETVLGAASRYIDSKTLRTFYPRVETRYYSVPDNSRQLKLDDDLLAVITLTNGDDTTLASTEYNLIPKNNPPHFAIKMKEASSYYWTYDSDGNTEWVIGVLGIWGYHDYYSQRAWSTGSDINMSTGLNATATGLVVDSVANFSADNIIKCENEIMRATGTSTGTQTVTVVRGENGSTAAAHSDDTSVTIWEPIADIREACLMIAGNYYKRRFGENATSETVITSGGVVITPRDVPGLAAETLRVLKKWL